MQKRILFVDDEELLRELYSSLDMVLGEEHEVFTAGGGNEALSMIKERSFDVIVSDLAMPQMDGVQFFTEVVNRNPQAARIVISGFADRLKVAECLSVGHRFFNKPVNLKSLTSLLKRICSYSYLVSNERVRKIICGSNALPTPPDTYLRLTEALNSEFTEVEDIARIIQQDPGITTKLLHLVNSAQFGFARQIVVPSEAVSLLGVEVIRALILGSHIFNFFDESPFVKETFQELWKHSLETAVDARKLARAEGLPTPQCEECFLAGLLHDVGKLVLAANAEPEYRMVLELKEKKGIPLEQAELGIFESTHAQAGAYLLALWGLPEGVVRAVELHHDLDAAGVQEFGPLMAIEAAQNLKEGRETLLNEKALDKAGLLGRVPLWTDVLQGE